MEVRIVEQLAFYQSRLASAFTNIEGDVLRVQAGTLPKLRFAHRRPNVDFGRWSVE